MPLGLSNGEIPRQIDTLLRAHLHKGSKSTIFTAPCRPALYQETYAAANFLNKSMEGKGISKQSWNIFPKIRELDQFLIDHADLRSLVYESHPEYCFQRFNGMSPLSSKHSTIGKEERISILGRLLPAMDLSDFWNHIALAKMKYGTIMDKLDAMVLSLAAQSWDRISYLEKYHEVDDLGIPMRIPSLRACVE